MAKTASGKNGKETKVYFRGSTAGLKILNSANYMYMKYNTITDGGSTAPLYC